MTYPRGYKLFEPLNPANPNPQADNLIKTFNEGVDYQVADTNINFIETLVNSTYLNGGNTEYRYFVAFDDENVGVPSNIFSLINLMPPTNLLAEVIDYDTLKITFTSAEFASGYEYQIKDITNNSIPIQGVLSESGLIVNLNANTTYEIKLASFNNKNEKTEWTNESVQAKTWVTFELKVNVGDRHLTWDWTYDDPDAIKFELFNNKDGSILYTGTDKKYEAYFPVGKYENFCRITTSSGNIRDTKILSADVFHADKLNGLAKEDMTTTGRKNGTFMKIDFYRALITKSFYQVNFFKIISKGITSVDTTFYYKSNSLIGYRLSIHNILADSHIFYNDYYEKYKTNSYVKVDLFYKNAKIAYTKLDFFNKVTNVYNFYNDFRLHINSNIPAKLNVVTNKSNTIGSNLIVYQDDTLYYGVSRIVYNIRKTPFPFDNKFYNYRKTNISRFRQTFYNSLFPFDIDNIDFVTNATITNIDVQSQINKVRILCIGDSITAGAPLYDPYYKNRALTWRHVIETPLIARKSLEFTLLTYHGDIDRGIANHNDIVKICKIG